MCKAPKEDEFRGAESTGAGKGMMAGANLFGLINAVLTCVVLGIVATRGGDVTKKTTNNAAAAGTTTTLAIPDFLKGYTHYGENPCIDSTGQIHLYMDRPNQTPVYFVMVGGKVKHRGSYKHCREVFNRLTRVATA